MNDLVAIHHYFLFLLILKFLTLFHYLEVHCVLLHFNLLSFFHFPPLILSLRSELSEFYDVFQLFTIFLTFFIRKSSFFKIIIYYFFISPYNLDSKSLLIKIILISMNLYPYGYFLIIVHLSDKDFTNLIIKIKNFNQV